MSKFVKFLALTFGVSSIPSVPFPWLVLKTFPCCARAVPTELNNLQEKADYIEIKSFMNKVLKRKTTGMNTVSFEKKITGLRRLAVPLKMFRTTYKTYVVSLNKTKSQPVCC